MDEKFYRQSELTKIGISLQQKWEAMIVFSVKMLFPLSLLDKNLKLSWQNMASSPHTLQYQQLCPLSITLYENSILNSVAFIRFLTILIYFRFTTFYFQNDEKR